MGANVKKALQVAAVVGVSALFVALSVATPREGLNPLGELAGKLWHLALFLVFWFAVYALGRGRARPGRRPPLIWRFDMGERGSGGVHFDGRYLYAGGTSGRVYAFDEKSIP